MPFENIHGDVTHGVGGGFASINNTAFAIGGVGGWIDDDTVGFVSGRPEDIINGRDWQAMRFHRPTEKFTSLSSPASGANHMFCGGGHAAWWWGTTDNRRGLYSTTGFRKQELDGSVPARDAGLLGMGPDGAIGYKPLYHSNGPTRMRELDGRDWLLTNGHAESLCLLGNGRAIWLEGFTLHSVGFDTPPLYSADSGIWGVQAVQIGARWWISYYSGMHGIVLHPFDSFQGFSILPKGDGWKTIRVIDTNTIRVATSRGAGEQPGEIWVRDYDVVQNTVIDPWTVRSKWLPVGRVDIRTINVIPSEFAPFNHSVLIIPFKDPIGVSGVKSIEAEEIGIYSETVDPTTIIAAAALRKTRVLLGHDSPAPWLIPKLRPWDIPLVELYRLKTETLSESVSRWRGLIQSMITQWPGDCGVIPMFYCQGGAPPDELWTVQEVLDGLAYLSELVNLSPRIKIVAPFAWERLNGITAHPELRTAFESLKRATPGRPTLTSVGEPMTQPRFTVTAFVDGTETPFPIASERPVAVRMVYVDQGGGKPDWIEWLSSPHGKDGPWTVGTRNPGTDKDHTFRFSATGTVWVKARAGNAAGVHGTGLERRVVLAEAVVIQPEDDESAIDVQLPSYEDFINVEGPAVDTAYGPGETLSDVLHAAWRRLNENWSHDNILRDLHGTPTEGLSQRQRLPTPTYDQWMNQEGPEILETLRTMGRVPTPGDLRHNAWRRFVERWTLDDMLRDIDPDKPMPEAPAVIHRTGVVVPDGRAVRDDQGLFHPLGISFFWAMQGWKHEREHYERNAAWIAAKGFDYIRILTEVGWTGREINPGAPGWIDWADVLRSVIDDFYNRGVRTELTLVGKGTNTDPLWLARTVGDIVADGRQHKIMDVEMANEYAVHGGPNLDTLSQMAREVKARVPNLVALSSPGDFPALLAETKRIGINCMTWHSDRGSGDYKWRQVRQGYDSKNFKPFVLSNNEPAGPGSSVNTNTSPLQIAMTRAVGIVCGGAGYVLHTGSGVFGDGHGHPTAGPRPANFDEIDNIDAIVDALRGIDALLPEGCENWDVQVSRSTDSSNRAAPFTPHHHWEGSTGDGVNKAYSALAEDGQWIQMPCGVRGHVALTASYPVDAVTVYDPLTRQPIPGFENRTFAQGDTMDLPGGGEDAMVAYIIQGRR